MPTTYAAFDVPPHRVLASCLPPPMRRDQRRCRLTVRAAAAKITERNESLSNSSASWRRVENLRNDTVSSQEADGPCCTVGRAGVVLKAELFICLSICSARRCGAGRGVRSHCSAVTARHAADFAPSVRLRRAERSSC